MEKEAKKQTKIPVFKPSMMELNNFSAYVKFMEQQCKAHHIGIAKIKPPKEWCPRKQPYEDISLVIPQPVAQVAIGKCGVYQQFSMKNDAMTVKEFIQRTKTKNHQPVFEKNMDAEKVYWEVMTDCSAMYGSDVEASLFDKDKWNLSKLDTVLNLISEENKKQNVEWMNKPRLNFGTWKATFAWQTDDMDLYRIHYLHFGAPTFWYVIPPKYGHKFEKIVLEMLEDKNAFQCPAFLRHRTTLISPAVLTKLKIPYRKVVQCPGEFVVTFPYAYYSGFHLGLNCSESVYFASERWINYGKKTKKCTCEEQMQKVKFDMDIFVKQFQPKLYDSWKKSQLKGKNGTRLNGNHKTHSISKIRLNGLKAERDNTHCNKLLKSSECYIEGEEAEEVSSASRPKRKSKSSYMHMFNGYCNEFCCMFPSTPKKMKKIHSQDTSHVKYPSDIPIAKTKCLQNVPKQTAGKKLKNNLVPALKKIHKTSKKMKFNFKEMNKIIKRCKKVGMIPMQKNEKRVVKGATFGPIKGVKVGTVWRTRNELFKSGVHCQTIQGIHSKQNLGAYSIILSGGYEDDLDKGEEFLYTGSGGQDLSIKSSHTKKQSCDQELKRQNRALALNCNAAFDDVNGAEAQNWREGKEVRVVRSCKGRASSPYCPKEGIRYDGIYKVAKYWPECGKSGFLVWRFWLRRDDPSPPPWKNCEDSLAICANDFKEIESTKSVIKNDTICKELSVNLWRTDERYIHAYTEGQRAFVKIENIVDVLKSNNTYFKFWIEN